MRPPSGVPDVVSFGFFGALLTTAGESEVGYSAGVPCPCVKGTLI